MIRNIKIKHPLVIDGIESCEFSQYFPFHPNVAVTAVARELCGFVWAIMNTGPQLTG